MELGLQEKETASDPRTDDERRPPDDVFGFVLANLPPEVWLTPGRQLPTIGAPTMGLWSSGDGALTERQMTSSSENVTGPWRYERLDGPGHWMQLEAPDQVNRLLLDFLPR